jgi:DNA-binding beta-propeller fold protein YncE
VDKWGYQVLKTTYDLQKKIVYYDTDYPPTNMALSKELRTGIILYLNSNTVDKINFKGERITRYSQIENPMDIVFNQADSLFWIVDSSGILYSLNSKTDQLEEVSRSLIQPTNLVLDITRKRMYVIDRGLKAIVLFNERGEKLQTIATINQQNLSDPLQFAIDGNNNRTWLIDRRNEYDYIYSKNTEEINYALLDSVLYTSDLRGDLEINEIDQSIWFISYNKQNSAVVQLSATGSRQLVLSGYYDPFDIAINPYDGTLLVADSGHSSVVHYNRDNLILGQIKNLQFPVKVLIE